MEITKRKKRLTYLIGFLIMLSSHYLMKDNLAKSYDTINMFASYDATHSPLCLDQIEAVSYYRLNCPVCRSMIEALTNNP